MSQVTTLLPGSQGAYNNWILISGASKPVAVQSQDGDTSYIGDNNSALRESFLLNNTIGSSVVILADPLVKGQIKDAGGGGINETLFLRLGGVNQDGSAQGITGSWVIYQSTITRPGGGTWSGSDLNTLEVGLFGSNANGLGCSFLSADITWDPMGGFFTYLVGGLGPIIGAGLGLAEMPKLARFIRSRTPHLILPSSYARAWREIRDYRWPVSVEVGA